MKPSVKADVDTKRDNMGAVRARKEDVPESWVLLWSCTLTSKSIHSIFY